MRFTIVREEFLKALNSASKAIDSKAKEMPIITNFKLELNENGLFVLSTNINITIKILVPFKKNDKELIRNYKEGQILVNAELLTNIIRKLESDEIVFEVIESSLAVISINNT